MSTFVWFFILLFNIGLLVTGVIFIKFFQNDDGAYHLDPKTKTDFDVGMTLTVLGSVFTLVSLSRLSASCEGSSRPQPNRPSSSIELNPLGQEAQNLGSEVINSEPGRERGSLDEPDPRDQRVAELERRIRELESQQVQIEIPPKDSANIKT